MTVFALPGTWTYLVPPTRPEGASGIPECCPGIEGAGGASPGSAPDGDSSTGLGDWAWTGVTAAKADTAATDIAMETIKNQIMSASLPLLEKMVAPPGLAKGARPAVTPRCPAPCCGRPPPAAGPRNRRWCGSAPP